MATDIRDKDVIYHLRDKNKELVTEWATKFQPYQDNVKPSVGDIFLGAPAVDAIVCPSNSFGVNGGGGIENQIYRHYGLGILEQLQEVIENEFEGEILVGQAVVLSGLDRTTRNDKSDWSKMNDGNLIKFLIVAPTMRISQSSRSTPNAYLAFRAVILAVREHNRKNKQNKITRVLMPGLGTSGAKMPPQRCAKQMLEAYETFAVGLPTKKFRLRPSSHTEMLRDHIYMCLDEKVESKKVPNL
ncbi:ADP-ribose 1-phosphate phosphatase YML087W [Biomphalaria glabrata]|uniref:Uncharacterized protein LOC106052593 n=1 Tax=Biomphalaria glabrata TaxID=6526 RepID=A0A9W3ALI8_BIOGL|nr:uncharacterized protein LOC106052593 [Biomphalaria glabrata]XP_055887988.1 uncharacterized protein LOC106052593 [Biomphalaria glabrata]KAI8758916.1 putative ADP-ribose 1''-phosphate phosphatase [Biomphalaria glabrata]KAI8792396.1 ADP-ribose 1-phosphate phosphatase [Biomphalaria glabrata]